MIDCYQRVERALVIDVTELYATCISTRRVAYIAEKMGVARLSEDQTGVIAASLDAYIDELCGRPLDGAPLPYVWSDAT